MKKIPTLFKREFQDHHVISISPEVSSPDLAWVLAGEGVATEKIDGACCAIMSIETHACLSGDYENTMREIEEAAAVWREEQKALRKARREARKNDSRKD